MLVHDLEAHIQIEEHRYSPHTLAHILHRSCKLRHAIDVALGEDVIEHVYLSHPISSCVEIGRRETENAEFINRWDRRNYGVPCLG
jgi:hypothetical protein